jgi:hypothetical protein
MLTWDFNPPECERHQFLKKYGNEVVNVKEFLRIS